LSSPATTLPPPPSTQPVGSTSQPEGRDIFLISDLCSLLETYLAAEQVQEVYRAYLFSAEAHQGQHRLTGEPYIYHPIAVARILGDMRVDYRTLAAAVLHDVIEDTRTPKEVLAREFGEEVAELVDGVSKISQLDIENRAEAQAENFRKMLLAMARDIRVIVIKLADRLHNMRTLGAMPPEKRRRIARETLEIYAPIASRLGMNAIRLELEDLGFAALHPSRARVLRHAMMRARGHRREIVDKIETALKRRLRQEDLDGRVCGREKHLYGIYRKMQAKGLSFDEVFDIYAFRIVTDNVDTCYRVLGAVHNLYKPVPGRFKDYIAIPKANGYQSLHTVLIGPYGVHLEVQIRTEEMDKVAEAGIAAHWLYKTGDTPNTTQQRAREWLRGLLEMQKSAGNSLEFLENVKVDLFPEEVYVFTPKGEIKVLPRGATAVDFAYAVHTDIGNACVAAKIDRRWAPLHTPLHSGQQVEILTAPGARPKPSWLNCVVTAKARANIRQYLKNLQGNEAVALGKRLLEKELSVLSLSLAQIPEDRLATLLQEFNLPSPQVLYEDIGLGKRLAPLVARRLSPESDARDRRVESRASRPLAIQGTEGMVVTFAKCCRPIPGDPIVGFVSAGRGIVIHTASCKNVAEFRDTPDKSLTVQWEPEVAGDFPAEIRVEVANQRGVLATVAAAIADMEANIENVSLTDRDGLYTTINFTVAVRGRQHLARIMRRVRANRLVLRIYRTKS
jgi:GTP diphosphokinase / guanosine-3',5'-bis(diphosphate) 3'-diphosphatase